MDVVDKMTNLPTNSMDQPLNPSLARINRITIENLMLTTQFLQQKRFKSYWHTIDDWINYRRRCGEQISEESWLVRNLWDVTTPSGGSRGFVIVPKKLKDTGIKSLHERELRAQGIRTKLKEGKKRYEFSTYQVLFFKMVKYLVIIIYQ